MGRSEVVMNFEITSGINDKPLKVVVYGPEGIGKSTFAAQFPEPLFIDTEGSTDFMNVRRLPKPTSYEMLKEEVMYAAKNKLCKTLVIDSIDWGERLIIDHICQKAGLKGIEDFGYGNGYVYLEEEEGRFLNLLEEARSIGNMAIVLTAHSQIRKFEEPNQTGKYDRYELKLGKKTGGKSSGLIREWADMVLFVNYQTFVSEVDNNGKGKAVGGKRMMYTTHKPCWDAKNRHGLPEECEFNYEVIRPFVEKSLTGNQFEQVRSVQPMSAPATDKKPQIQENVPVKPKEPQIKENNPVSAIDFESEEYQKIPSKVRDLMKCDNISIEKLKEVIFLKGFFPKDTPIENMPNDFWEFIASNWSNLKDFITETEMQF